MLKVRVPLPHPLEWIAGRVKPHPLPALQCTNYTTQAVGFGPNPAVCAGGKLEVFDSTGTPMVYQAGQPPQTNVTRQGTPPITGLDCGYRTVIKPAGSAMAAKVTVVQYAQPPRLEAIDATGSVTWQDKVTAGHGVPQTFNIVPTLTTSPIAAVVITSPSNETILLEACLP